MGMTHPFDPETHYELMDDGQPGPAVSRMELAPGQVRVGAAGKHGHGNQQIFRYISEDLDRWSARNERTPPGARAVGGWMGRVDAGGGNDQ